MRKRISVVPPAPLMGLKRKTACSPTREPTSQSVVHQPRLPAVVVMAS
jgi:hypothetical protein